MRKPIRKKIWTTIQVTQAGKSAEVRLERPLHVGHGGHAADRGHVALVKVAKGWTALLGEVGSDGFAHIVTHLHGGLGDARHLVAVLFEMSKVAEDEDFRQAWRIEIVVDNDTAALVYRRAEHLAERRGLHAGGP